LIDDQLIRSWAAEFLWFDCLHLQQPHQSHESWYRVLST